MSHSGNANGKARVSAAATTAAAPESCLRSRSTWSHAAKGVRARSVVGAIGSLDTGSIRRLPQPQAQIREACRCRLVFSLPTAMRPLVGAAGNCASPSRTATPVPPAAAAAAVRFMRVVVRACNIGSSAVAGAVLADAPANNDLRVVDVASGASRWRRMATVEERAASVVPGRSGGCSIVIFQGTRVMQAGDRRRGSKGGGHASTS